MNHRSLCTLGVWLAIGGSAIAASCPSDQRGANATKPSCATASRPRERKPVGQTRVAQARIEWSDRWGAIATGRDNAFGTASEQLSQHDADAAALAQCRDAAGGDCAIVQSYSNQCGAVAHAGAGTPSAIAASASAATIEDAERLSLRRCEKSAASVPASDCQVAYSGCSYPARAD